MADCNEQCSDEEPEISNTISHDGAADNSSVIVNNNHDNENFITNGNILTEDKDQELPEPIRDKDSRKDMPGLPFINLNQLSVILRDPSMPSQKIMQEVADKMMLKSEESESDDGSVGSSGHVGMKGLLDCIFEVTFQHTGSDNSDDDDDSFESIPREIPCDLCDKIFNNTMTWKTHVLVAHQDPSVLNIRRLSSEAEKEDKNQLHRKYSRGTSKSDSEMKETKTCFASKSDKENTVAIHKDGNTSPTKQRFSFSRSNKNKTPGEYSQTNPHIVRKSQPTEERSSTGYQIQVSKEVSLESAEKKSIKVVDFSIATNPLKILETETPMSGPVVDDSRLNEHIGDNSESHGGEQAQSIDQSSQVVKCAPETEEDSTVIRECPHRHADPRKRPAQSSSPDSITATSSVVATLLNPKRSRKDNDT